MKGQSHLETDRPCGGYPKQCKRCALAHWCIKRREEGTK